MRRCRGQPAAPIPRQVPASLSSPPTVPLPSPSASARRSASASPARVSAAPTGGRPFPPAPGYPPSSSCSTNRASSARPSSDRDPPDAAPNVARLDGKHVEVGHLAHALHQREGGISRREGGKLGILAVPGGEDESAEIADPFLQVHGAEGVRRRRRRRSSSAMVRVCVPGLPTSAFAAGAGSSSAGAGSTSLPGGACSMGSMGAGCPFSAAAECSPLRQPPPFPVRRTLCRGPKPAASRRPPTASAGRTSARRRRRPRRRRSGATPGAISSSPPAAPRHRS